MTSRHLPASSANAAPIGATWRDVVVAADRRVRFLRPLWLDLGGIAKGYAVDRAIAVLKRSGVRHGVVEAGGDLRVFGGAVTVHLRDPRHPTRISSALVVDDAAVASSGGYFSLVDGASALIRRSDGTRIDRHAATTVIAPRAIWADALTKVALADSTGANFVDLFERLHASARTTSADGSVHLVGSHAATG